jgi:hypothetical protein
MPQPGNLGLLIGGTAPRSGEGGITLVADLVSQEQVISLLT